MKNLLTGGISALLLSGLIVPVAQAQMPQQQMPQQQMPQQQMPQPTPGQMIPGETSAVEMSRIGAFNLAYLAYWDQLTEIPGFFTLRQSYQANKVTAMDIAEAAVDEGRLDIDALEDDNYLSALEQQLEVLVGTLGES